MDSNNKNGNVIEITINEDDIDLVKASEKFLNDLENQYKIFMTNLTKVQELFEEDNKKKGAKKIYFIPEGLSVFSPLTIIDAPWGSGKTYFIESFVKNFSKENIKGEKFKNIIVFDVYWYSAYDNIPYQIMIELFDILINQLDASKRKKKKLKKRTLNAFKFLSNKVFISIINKKIGTNLPELKEKRIEDLLKEINLKIKNTIIIFDNIERIGPNSWEILKTIFKISQLEKIIFILTMNKDMLEVNESISNNERWIEKFINIKELKLIQNYKSILKNLGFNDLEKDLINDLLIQEINGRKLSIRQLEKMVDYNEIIKLDNTFDRIKKFEEKIWEPSNNTEGKFKSIIETEYIELATALINDYLFFIKSIDDIYKKYLGYSKYSKYINSFEHFEYYSWEEIMNLEYHIELFWNNYEKFYENSSELKAKILKLRKEFYISYKVENEMSKKK